MKRLCKKFQNSIIFLMRAILFVASFVLFYGILGTKNAQLLVLSRTSVIIAFSWVVLTFLLGNIYGGFDVGHKRVRQIELSMSISTVIIDVVAYLMLNIMNRNEDNNQTFKIEFMGLFVVIILIQILLIVVFANAGNKFFYWVTEPKNTLVISPKGISADKICKSLKKLPGNFNVSDIISADDENLYEKMKAVDAVFLYDVEVGLRTEMVNYCYKHLKDVYFNPEVADILEMSASQTMFDDMAFLSMGYKGMSFEQRIIKRAIDIIISLVALIISSPIFLISAIAIKRGDGGKVFFRQRRATINGRVFEIYKFRTMRENVENFSSTKDDERITGVGKILRKYRLDELPQFINILKGEMSIVGPRPEMLENVDEYTKELPEFKYRLRMKAGLTGYAQILGKYNTSSKDKLMLDLMYIENFSILKDIQLIFQTVTVLFTAEDSTEGF